MTASRWKGVSVGFIPGLMHSLKFEFWLVLTPYFLVSLLCAESFSPAFLEICELSNILSIKSFPTKIGQRWLLMFETNNPLKSLLNTLLGLVGRD